MNITQNKVINLSQNENPLGPSPLAVKALLENYNSMSLYPEPHGISIKRKIAKKLGVEPENILVSAGLIEALDILVRNFILHNENIIVGEYSFVAYRQLVEVFGVKPKFSKMKDYRFDIDAVLNQYNINTKLIIIDNPNNPTGSIITETELVKLLSNISKNTYVVIDEAYFEYAMHPEYPDSLKLQKEYPNLIIMRSFSKIYGLAGLRIGYTIASKEIIEKMEYFQAPFTVNQIASIAAIAAIDDEEFLAESCRINNAGRVFLTEAFEALRYRVVYSDSNFLFVYFENAEERNKVTDALEKNDILIRKTDIFGADNAFRITIGTPELNAKVIECINNELK